MGKWYIVRHGKTAWNIAGRIQGQSDMPLSPLGYEQARMLGIRLQQVKLAAAYCSDLSRAVQTAETVLQGHGIPVQRATDLREFAYGPWEGLSFQEAQRDFPVEYAEFIRMSVTFAPPGAETAIEVTERARRFRDGLLATHGPADDLLIVGHSGSLKGLLVTALGLPVEAFWRFRLVPASLSIVTIHDPGATLDLWNDTSHLEGLDG